MTTRLVLMMIMMMMMLLLQLLLWLFRCSFRGDASGVAPCQATSSPSCCVRTSSLGTLRPPLCCEMYGVGRYATKWKIWKRKKGTENVCH
uniref:Putative secreted protein n=1 Tax=Anopheles darlingi TaxID=43151 RepID=A0A2M4D2J7_ANODA